MTKAIEAAKKIKAHVASTIKHRNTTVIADGELIFVCLGRNYFDTKTGAQAEAWVERNYPNAMICSETSVGKGVRV